MGHVAEDIGDRGTDDVRMPRLAEEMVKPRAEARIANWLKNLIRAWCSVLVWSDSVERRTAAQASRCGRRPEHVAI